MRFPRRRGMGSIPLFQQIIPNDVSKWGGDGGILARSPSASPIDAIETYIYFLQNITRILLDDI